MDDGPGYPTFDAPRYSIFDARVRDTGRVVGVVSSGVQCNGEACPSFAYGRVGAESGAEDIRRAGKMTLLPSLLVVGLELRQRETSRGNRDGRSVCA